MCLTTGRSAQLKSGRTAVAQLQTFALVLHLQKIRLSGGEAMYPKKSYLILLLTCILCITSCAKIIQVEVRDIGNREFVVSAHERVWRKGVCISSVILQKDDKIIWVAGIDRGSKVCVDHIQYPSVPLGFTVNRNVEAVKGGVYVVSVLSEAGMGSARFELK